MERLTRWYYMAGIATAIIAGIGLIWTISSQMGSIHPSPTPTSLSSIQTSTPVESTPLMQNQAPPRTPTITFTNAPKPAPTVTPTVIPVSTDTPKPLGIGEPMWHQIVSIDNEEPPALAGAASAFDGLNRMWYVFGGHDGFNETAQFWKYSLDNNRWTRIASVNTPPPTSSAAAVWDEAYARLLVYGGNYCCKDTLWAYSPDSNKWEQLPPAPQGRAGAVAVWDPDNAEMIVFGGVGNTGEGSAEDGGCCRPDLFAYQVHTRTWVKLKPAPVLGNHGPSAVWDDDSHQMIVFGGPSPGGFTNFVWSYSPTTDSWEKAPLPIQAPSPRGSHQAMWDSSNRRMIVFGGYGGSIVGNFNEIWVYDPVSNSFAMLSPTGLLPSARREFVSAWDSVASRMLIWGGEGTGRLNDLWALTFLP